MFLKSILLSSLVMISLTGFSQQKIKTSESLVKFKISNMGFRTVNGTFSAMSGNVNFNPDSLASSSFEVCVKVNTVNTENETRDEHLLKEDFFDEKTYPEICFKSTSISKTSEGYSVLGSLEMHGVSKSVEIPFIYSDKTFRGSLTVNRLDYGIGNDGTFMVGDEVELEIVCKVN